MVLVCDASILVAAVLEHEKHHARAKKLVAEIAARTHRMMLPTSCLVEVTAALARRAASVAKGLEMTSRAQQELLNAWDVLWQPVDLNFAQESANCARRFRLRGMDALYAATALRFDLPLLTEDDEIKERCSDAIEVLSLSDLVP